MVLTRQRFVTKTIVEADGDAWLVELSRMPAASAQSGPHLLPRPLPASRLLLLLRPGEDVDDFFALLHDVPCLDHVIVAEAQVVTIDGSPPGDAVRMTDAGKR